MFLVVAMSLLFLCNGCAWNEVGARVERRENETSRFVRVDVWGIHLVTGSDDSGVTLGHSRRDYIYPKVESRDRRDVEFMVGNRDAERFGPPLSNQAAATPHSEPIASVIR